MIPANPNDFVTWHHKGKSDGPLRFWDAMWSLFSNSGDFYRCLEHHVPQLVRQQVPANEALERTLTAVCGDLLPHRNRMMRHCLDALAKTGVPFAQLTPELVAQDWGQSQLTSRGQLTMRLEAWMRRSPETVWRSAVDLRVRISADRKRIEVIG